MAYTTAIAQRLELAVEQEIRKMQNEWFFKWHFIGENRVTEIDGFDGRMIKYGGIQFSGSAVSVYWDAISRYTRQRVSSLFDEVEGQLSKYPEVVRSTAIKESVVIISGFASAIRVAASEKAAILSKSKGTVGNTHIQGNWRGSSGHDIDARADALTQSYCPTPIKQESPTMSLKDMMNDRLTFVKKTGEVIQDDIRGLVTKGKVITFESSLPVEVGDRFLRKLPAGVVEDYIVQDPGFFAAMSGIAAHFQSSVRRSDSPAAPAHTIINNIQGENARVNIGSHDHSQNLVVNGGGKEIFDSLRQRLSDAGLDPASAAPIAVAIEQMERSLGTPSFKDKYVNFISIASDHIGVFGPILAALAGLMA